MPVPISTSPVPTTVEVSGLGRLTGWLNPDGTKQFFNVPYADIEKRFTHSKLKTSWPDDKWDGQLLGAASPQPIRPFYPFPMPERLHLKYNDLEIQDEFTCCNLHITVPAGCSLEDNLSILVFIHGGGFVFGTANYSMLDGRHLANLSVELGMPTIIITPNYRLGFYGFLASHDIGAESPEGNGNFGLVDQRNALIWVNKYISSFGGDPQRVLLTGVSAGGISVDVHMRSQWNHLFHTAVLQSGTVPICGMYSVEEYNVLYEKLLLEVGIDLSLPGKERLAALRQVRAEVIDQATYEVFQGLNLPQFGVCQDGILIGQGETLPIPQSYWKQDLTKVYKGKVVVGDCKHEGIIYDQSFRDYSVDHIRKVARTHLPFGLVDEYLNHYNVRDGMTDLERYNSMESMVTDGIFGALPAYLAETNPQWVHVYHWDHASLFKNPWKAYAHHSLDYMFLFGNVNAIITSEERELVRSIGTDFIAFANGNLPYPVFGEDRTVRQYGPHSRTTTLKGDLYTDRPTAWFERIAPHMTAVDALCTDLIMRRPQLVSREYGPGSKNRVNVTQGKPMAL